MSSIEICIYLFGYACLWLLRRNKRSALHYAADAVARGIRHFDDEHPHEDWRSLIDPSALRRENVLCQLFGDEETGCGYLFGYHVFVRDAPSFDDFLFSTPQIIRIPLGLSKVRRGYGLGPFVVFEGQRPIWITERVLNAEWRHQLLAPAPAPKEVKFEQTQSELLVAKLEEAAE